MALKEKALKRLCGRLNKAGIPYLLTGAWMLSARGFEDAWHGFDVAVPGSCAEKADEVLTKLGMRTPVRETERSCEIHYHFDGADITLHGGYELPGDIRFEPPFAMDTTVVLGEEVPLMTLEDAFALRQEHVAAARSDAVTEAVEALTALGYSSSESLRVVRGIEGAGQMEVEQLLKLALAQMI